MIHIFNENSLHRYLYDRLERAKEEVRTLPNDRLLNADAAYIALMTKRHELDPIVFYRDKVSISGSHKTSTIMNHGRPIQVRHVTFHLPYEGPFDLLRWRPSKGILWTCEITHSSTPKEVMFDVADDDRPERVRDNAEAIMNNIDILARNVNLEIDEWKITFARELGELITNLREKAQRETNKLNSLGYPVRK